MNFLLSEKALANQGTEIYPDETMADQGLSSSGRLEMKNISDYALETIKETPQPLDMIFLVGGKTFICRLL